MSGQVISANGEASADAGAVRLGGVRGWLANVPVADPVDRRNAPMLQVILLLLGTTPALMWLYRVVAVDIPWRPGEVQGMLLGLATCAVALFGVLLIRRGRFQWAIRQMLALIAVSMIYAYATQGSRPQMLEQPLLVLWIVLSGLMVGRHALWLMFAAVAIAFAASGVYDVLKAADAYATPLTETMYVLTEVVMFLMIAIVVDRSVKALRESLDEASQRGDALAAANRQLEVEIAERRRTQEQLIHAQKVETVGRLAGGVAHDFNHLLGLMLGYAAKGRRSDDGAELKQALAGVEAAARRGQAVTHKLLDFSRHDAARVEHFDAGAALRDVQPLLKQLFGPRVRIVGDIPGRPLPVLFDRAQFDLVVLNIAANANQAMPDGGEFRMTLRGVDGAVEIELRDSGHGMSEEVRARLFEPFFTTRPVGQGTGLGLSVAHGAVVAQGGSISVDSVPGRGATFRVRLPGGENDGRG